jgi:hypothetical protein
MFTTRSSRAMASSLCWSMYDVILVSVASSGRGGMADAAGSA